MEEKIKKNSFKTRAFIVLIFIAIVACMLFINLRGTYLEYLEIGENYIEVFWTNIKYNYMGFLIIFIISFLSIYTTTMLIKKGLKQFFKEENKLMPKLPNKSISFIISIIISIAINNSFSQNLMLALNSASFEIADPIFNKDIGYYVFLRPFIYMIISYIAILIIGLAIYTAAYYIIAFNVYFDKGISIETLKKNTFIKQIFMYIFIVSILIGVTCIFKAQDILFERFINLKDQEKTYLYGAGFSSVVIKMWGYRILAFLIPIITFLSIKAFKKGEKRKTVAILTGVPIYLVGLFVVLFVFQMIIVKPNELSREKKYISNNIKFTKDAYNINVDEIEIQHTGTITEEEIENYSDILENIPIINSNMVEKTLMEYQRSTGYYTYPNVQISKYNIDGEDKLIYMSPREIVTDNGRTYPDKTYKYTHGYGIILADTTTVTEDGQIKYLQKDFTSTENVISIKEPRIYFGTKTNDTIVTNSKSITEFDYPLNSSTNTENIYEGSAGINLNFLDRMILAINKTEIGLIFTTNIKNDSKILPNRNIVERAKKIAPFLTYDENPYMVIDEDGSLKWVLDAYTTSNNYPYSQVSILEFEDGRKEKINYIRNSVKVIIDAYNGDIQFYITDRNDPIIMAYRNIYPTLFVELNEKIPESISKHFVYPEILYKIQADMLSRYHNIQSDILFRNDDVWQYSTHSTTKNIATSVPIKPYYVPTKENVSDKPSLSLVVPYTPYGKQNIISYLIGNYDENGNSKLTLYKFANGSNVLGTAQLDAQIGQDAAISKEINDLNIAGVKVVKDIVIVPVNNTLLYVESIYQISTNESLVPELKKVIVASGSKVAIGNNLKDAMTKLLSKSAIDIEIQNTDDKDELIDLIIKANLNLESSLNTADWEMIGKDIQKLQELISKLEILEGEENKNTNGNIIENTILDNF